MAKRLGTDPLDWIGDTRTKKGKSKKKAPEIKKDWAHKGLPDGWTRAMFIVKETDFEKLKALAYWDRTTIKELVAGALSRYLKGKKPKPVPKGKVSK